MIWGYPHLAAGYSPTKHLEILSCALWKPQIYPAGSCGFLAVCDGDLTDNEDPQIWLWRVQYVDFPWPKDEVLTGISLFQWEFQDPKMEVPTIYKAYVREYPHKIWPYMVHYLHFRDPENTIDVWHKYCTNAVHAGSRIWQTFTKQLWNDTWHLWSPGFFNIDSGAIGNRRRTTSCDILCVFGLYMTL